MSRLAKAAKEEYMQYQSIVNMREYFEAKAGSLQFFKEDSFWDYVRRVRSFVNEMEFDNPEEVIAIMKDDKERGLGLLRDYVKILRDRGCSPRYQIGCFSMLKTWLVRSDVELNFKKVVIPKARGVVSDRAPSKQELRKVLSYGRPWMVPGTLILTSSGMRVGTLLKLKLKHVDLESYEDLAIVEVPPEASKTTGVGYFTAINLEAKNALNQYLVYRRSPKKRKIGENTITVPGEVLTPESPLIVAPNAGGHMLYEVYRRTWTNALEYAGLDEKSGAKIVDGEEVGGHNVLHLHTLRKYFRSSVEGILTKSIREALMGHLTTEYLDQSYLRIPEEKLVSEYRKAAGALTVFEDTQSEDYQKKQILLSAAMLLPEDKLAMLKEILARTTTTDEAIAKFRELRMPTTPTNNGTVKVVHGEEEMIALVSQGWELLKEINGDRYLMKQSNGY